MTNIPPPFDALWFKMFVGIVVGLCLGSFITMLSYRLPRNLSIVTPPSHCPQCNHTLRVLDLIPVLSWIFNKGHCHFCKKSIGRRYLWIEILAAFMTMFAFARLGFSLQVLGALLLIVVLLTFATIMIEKSPS